MSGDFSGPFDHYRGNMKVELVLPNYFIMQQNLIWKEQDTDAYILASKTNLTRLVDDMDVHEPKTIPTYLSKLINIVDNGVVKKDCVW